LPTGDHREVGRDLLGNFCVPTVVEEFAAQFFAERSES